MKSAQLNLKTESLKPKHIKAFLGTSVLFLIIVLHSFFNSVSAQAKTSSATFPLYPAIKDNVAFWEQIYSTHSINTAVLHDKDNLRIVYATISLKDDSSPGAAKYNKKKIESAKRKYKKTLDKLAKGKAARFGTIKRVKKLFPDNTSKKTFAFAAQNMRIQKGLKERFKDGVIRSGAYMAEIKAIFKAKGLPEDLAYLPHVESSFNVKAYSKYGAAGIWQFTRSTGKNYMQIDDAIDERRDPIIAARAAAKFLQNNYEDLNNWPLAITAYNYGKAGMLRAKEAKGSYEKIFKYYKKGHFKFASRNFYSEFLAAVYVAKKLERSKTLRLHRPKNTISVRLPAYTSAPKFCSYLQISQSELKKYNPALLSTVYSGEKYIPKDYYLKLPSHRVRPSSLNKMPAHLFSPNQKRSLTYKVRRGDTASKIALDHKVSLRHLIARNNLNSKAQVYVGQVLKIPQSKPGTKNPKNIKTIKATTKKRYVSARYKTAKMGSPLAEPARLNVGNLHSKKGIIYGEVITQPGESVWLLAQWLKITENHLRSLNSLNSKQDISPGQKILLTFSATSRTEFEKKRTLFH